MTILTLVILLTHKTLTSVRCEEDAPSTSKPCASIFAKSGVLIMFLFLFWLTDPQRLV
jgi:hypothetical protein